MKLGKRNKKRRKKGKCRRKMCKILEARMES